MRHVGVWCLRDAELNRLNPEMLDLLLSSKDTSKVSKNESPGKSGTQGAISKPAVGVILAQPSTRGRLFLTELCLTATEKGSRASALK